MQFSLLYLYNNENAIISQDTSCNKNTLRQFVDKHIYHEHKSSAAVGYEIDINIRATVNPRISPLGAYLFLLLFGWGLIRGGLVKLFQKCHTKSSLPKLLFSILLQEQSIFKH